MPVLEYLPIELLRKIFSSLDHPELRKISLVSHLFNRVAEPFLYASLGGRTGWLLPSLSAIVNRPELARHVRCVDMGWWADEYPTPDDCVLFSTMAQHLGIVDVGWRDDSQALLLLHLVPDVRKLNFIDIPLLGKFIEETLTRPIESLPFKSLVNFKADEFTQSSSVTLTMLYALMRFPSLRKVTVDMQFSEDYTHNPSVVDSIIVSAGQAPITHLSLHYGNTTTSMLTNILQLPRALTHFSYWDDPQYPYVSDTKPLWLALSVLRPTLQSLTLRGVHALQLGNPGEQTIGVLHDWPALTEVECSLPALVGSRATSTSRLVDVLPMGIKVLFIELKDRLCRMKSHQEWNAREMTDQLVELVQSRDLVKLTINVCTGRPSRMERDWVNAGEAAVKPRLMAALSPGRSGGCVIDCW